jgi:hypothetical protein
MGMKYRFEGRRKIECIFTEVRLVSLGLVWFVLC